MNNDKCHPVGRITKLLVFSVFISICACGPGQHDDPFLAEDSTASEAIRQINTELRKAPANAELYYRKAKLYQNEHNVEQALTNLDKAIGIDSLNPLFRYQKGQWLFDLNQTLAASQEFERSIQLKPDFYDAYLRLGQLYLIVKKHQRSLELLSKAQQLNPADARPYFYKAMNFKDAHDTTQATISFQRALELDNTYYEAALQLGLLLEARHDKRALDYYNTAVRLNPKAVDALYTRGLYLQELGKLDEAVADYKKIIELNPDYYRAYYNIGFINAYNQKYDRAIDNFSNAIMANAEYTDAYYMRGYCHEMLKHKEDALNNYNYALQLDPEYTRAMEGKKRLQ